MTKNKKLLFINYLYAIGTFLVILGHSTPTGTSDMPLVFDDARTFIYAFHMPLFFFVAGFLLKYTTDIKKKPYGTFMKNKCIRFLVPYFVLSAVFFVPKNLISSFVNDNVSLDITYLIKNFLSPRDNVWGHFWFLPTLLLVYSLSYVLLKSYNNKILFSLVLFGTLLLALFPIDIDWFAINDICDQLFYFCLGICLEKFILENRTNGLNPFVPLIAVIFAVIVFTFFKSNNYFELTFLINTANTVIALLMLYAVVCFSTLLEKNGNRFLDYFEGKTFSIYIMSWPCQAVAEVVFNRMLHLHWFIVMPLMFCFGLGIPVAVDFLYRKLEHHPKFINLVFGFNIK